MGCVIPDGTVIGKDPVADAKHSYVTPNGIALITPALLGQEFHHVR